MRLSVVIPVYNQEILLKKALDSIPKKCQIIVVNDGSTDGTLDTAQKFADDNQDIDVIILSNETNLGVASTVNRGIDAATGDYIVLLGSDDYFYTGAIERVMDMMDGTDLIYFNLRTNEGQIFKLTPETKHMFCGSVKLMKREFIGDTRNVEGTRCSEDYIFYMALMSKNPTEKFTDITAKHYNFPRIGSLTNMAHKK